MGNTHLPSGLAGDVDRDRQSPNPALEKVMRKVLVEIEISIQPHRAQAVYNISDEGHKMGQHWETFHPEKIDKELQPHVGTSFRHAYLNDSGEILIMDEPLKPQTLGAYIDAQRKSIEQNYESGHWRES